MRSAAAKCTKISKLIKAGVYCMTTIGTVWNEKKFYLTIISVFKTGRSSYYLLFLEIRNSNYLHYGTHIQNINSIIWNLLFDPFYKTIVWVIWNCIIWFRIISSWWTQFCLSLIFISIIETPLFDYVNTWIFGFIWPFFFTIWKSIIWYFWFDN